MASPAAMDAEQQAGETRGLLKAVTFRSSAYAAPSAETLMTRVFGTKNAANQRVSESLDYEPVQNKIFYERMRQSKRERHLFG